MYDPEMRNVMTMATVEAIAYEDQDRADGEALRRLREALPERWGFTVSDYPGKTYLKDGQPAIQAMAWPDLDMPIPNVERRGATIAEAADACRKALPRVPA